MEEYLMKMVVCGNALVESFRSHRTHSRLRQLSLSNFYFCAAPNSGPIALLFRKYEFKQLKLQDQLDCSIILFDCRGELLRTVPFELKERVILFQFTTDEHLLIVYASGTYFLLDTATATLRTGAYFSEDDLRGKGRATGALLVNDKVLILREKTLGIVDELQGKWQSLPNIRLHSQWPLFDAVTLSPSGEVKILFLNHTYQIEICGTGKYDKTDILVGIPELRSLCPILLKIGLRDNKVVLVFTDFLLWVDSKEQKIKDKERGKISVTKQGLNSNSIENVKNIFGDKAVFYDDFKIQNIDPMCKTTSANKYRNFYALGWLSDGICYFNDRQKVFVSSYGHPKAVKVSAIQNNYLLAQGNDIFRIIEDNTFVFRAIDDPIYLALAGHSQLVQPLLSHNSDHAQNFGLFTQVLFLFENFSQKKPNEIQRLKKLEGKLGCVLDSLLEGASRSLDAGMQLRVLRLAQWVQTVSGERRDFRQLAGRLRVVNGLRYEHLARWLSLNQFQQLRTDRFLNMLLRSNMHYVADLIFEDSASKRKIFLHWGKCKIQKQQPLAAVQQIQLRYADMKRDLHSKFVFTELALYALRRPSPLTDLALRLAQNEPHPARKCMVFLLAFKDKGTPELVDKLLDFAEQSFCTGAIYRTLTTLKSLNDVPRQLWVQLLPKRPFLQSFYLKVLKAQGNNEDLKTYLQTNKKYSDLAQLTLARQLREKQPQTPSQMVSIVQQSYSKLLPNLASQLPRCKPNASLAKLRALRVQITPITEKDTEQFSKDGELEVLGQIIQEKDRNIALALSCWRRIKSEKIYEVLRVKGRFREAMQVAFQRRDRVRLEQMIQEADEDAAEAGHSMLKELIEGRR